MPCTKNDLKFALVVELSQLKFTHITVLKWPKLGQIEKSGKQTFLSRSSGSCPIATRGSGFCPLLHVAEVAPQFFPRLHSSQKYLVRLGLYGVKWL